MRVDGTPTRTVWMEGTVVRMIDQPRLPHSFQIADLTDYHQTAQAISTMIVRGAGAIGATGAYGIAQAALQAPDEGFHQFMADAAQTMANTRPTAQNLFYGIRHVMTAIEEAGSNLAHARQAAVAAAQAVADDDAACCEAIGQHGEALIPQEATISTHCNAGWLAFVDWGSAISPIYAAHRAGKRVHVLVDETRPRGQGARLTAWELGQEGVSHAIIADNATGWLMQRGEIDLVIVGSDRIAANGDVANKIGTYNLALVARAHGIPFYVCAPGSSIDRATVDGDAITIEERDAEEITHAKGVGIAAPGAQAWNPAFDITPAHLVTGFITEFGVLRPPYREVLSALPLSNQL